MSQHAIDSSAVLGFVRNQMYFYHQRNPVSLAVPTAIASPGDGAFVRLWTNRSRSVRRINPLFLTLWTSSTRLAFTMTRSWSSNRAFWRSIMAAAKLSMNWIAGGA
eukprot:218975-Pleurochrysis_carterae.AAC.1